MIDRTNVMPASERREPALERRDEDGVQTALAVIHEVLARLQELGDFARRARSSLPTPRDYREPEGAGRDLPEGAAQPERPRPSPTTDRDAGETPSEAPNGRKLQLTRRQQQVLDLLMQGSSNRRIGRSLHITEQTVKAHLHMIYHKLGAADRTEAVVIAMHHGLVPESTSNGPVRSCTRSCSL
ncbi:helix-turn-helix transcriptional regulator [Actinoalloteichus sp. AHMU CJ021]|uniref:CrmR2 n=3 Tax=Pseudonocardiaceae TaxID=2070 RepID=H8Y6P1_9PSEU|nr:CrmR2 [Actinoalloteichus sp. WH1-2216-6]AUS77164.1 helix-turn-helix transcriptional regulator [Actinoalloteichus sp. AHMU CJ021]MCP2330975.1 regulatory protein, luxR family [Actinoalloteichus caeruleus DSM 43889]